MVLDGREYPRARHPHRPDQPPAPRGVSGAADAELARRLAAGPQHFPHTLDLAEDRLLLLELSEAQIAQASFLDQRVVTPQTRGAWAGLNAALAAADPGARDDAGWIFHIGHVGSTLLSRLLGQLPQVLALREPLVLRELADVVRRTSEPDAPWDPARIDTRIAGLRRLLSRTFRPEQGAVIKATSFVSEIAPRLVAPGARAVLLHASPQSYMRTILAGPESLREAAHLTGPRLLRLARLMDDMPYRAWSLGLGERVALGWAVETLSLQVTADALPPGDALWLDFDALLADAAPGLARTATHLGLALAPDAAERLARDPLMSRYSKGPEHAYGPDLRRRLQAQAAREHAGPLADGLRWLDVLARSHPALARAMGDPG